MARADIFVSYIYCFTMMNDWLIDHLYFDWCYSYTMYNGDGAVGVTTMSSLVAPRVVLVTVCDATGRCLVECYSEIAYTGDGAVGVTTCCRLWHRGLSLWQPAVPRVDAGSSHWQHFSVLMSLPHEYTCWVFDEYTRIDILTHWPWGQMADIFNTFLHIPGCSLESKLKNVSVV